MVVLSTGNVYALIPVSSAGSVETDALTPLGEYANAAVARERLFARLVPLLAAGKVGAQPRDRLFLPVLLHVLGRTIARRAVGGGVVAEPVGQRLDQARVLP